MFSALINTVIFSSNSRSRLVPLFRKQLCRKQSSQVSSNPPEDKPLSYLNSEAAKWKAEYVRSPPEHERVSWAPTSVGISVGSFLVYFCILREENDIDEIIYRPLPETIKGIDTIHPDIDFYTKPAYVTYHENKREERKQRKLKKNVNVQ